MPSLNSCTLETCAVEIASGSRSFRGSCGFVSPWQDRLYRRLREQAYPLMAFSDGVIPAASLWAGMRLWCAAFRSEGLVPGDRVVLALPPSPAFVMVLLAALWEGLTLAPLDPKLSAEQALNDLDARLAVSEERMPGAWQPDACGVPPSNRGLLRPAHSPPTPDARLLLQTSGTTNLPRWIALSDTNLFAVLDSHRDPLNLRGARALSALPWHHAFGLILDLLPALLAGAEIVRAPDGGRDIAHLLHLMEREQTTHFSAVPLVVQRMAATNEGQNLLQGLNGGVVGGAYVGGALAEFLGQTRLRVGYGQTEAAPGLALGKPGQWAAGYLGQPLGCHTRVDAQGLLRFAGPNACLGVWNEAGLRRLDPQRWVCTGDLVWAEGPHLFYRGRADAAFKLSNGRLVQTAHWESELKRHFPQLEDVLLFTCDNEHLCVCVTRRACGPLPDLQETRAVFGSLGRRLHSIRETSPSEWKRRPKGDVDRPATIAAFLARGAFDLNLNSPTR